MLDGIEDQKALSIMEKNFRRILKKHTSNIRGQENLLEKTEQKSNGANLVIKIPNFSIRWLQKLHEEFDHIHKAR
jgi:hypothetical protein